MTSTREDYGVRKPPSLKVASESYREEICGVARLHDAGGREPEHESPAVRERRAGRPDMQSSAPPSVASRSALRGES
jgi:hypothetical protein